MDGWLQKRLEKYSAWMDGNRIAFSSRVIPVRASLADEQWVLPTEQVLRIIQKAESIVLADCVCRSYYKRCTKPVAVCLLLDDYGERLVEKATGKRISYNEATAVLEVANREGLVHLSLYRPDHKLYALCSCCACCCHDLQLLMAYGQSQLVAHSDYVSTTDIEACLHCGQCIERCVFGARKWVDAKMNYDLARCFGCGLCVTTCPANAITMAMKLS